MNNPIFKNSIELTEQEKVIILDEVSIGFQIHQGTVTAWSKAKILQELEDHNILASFNKCDLLAVILYRNISSKIIEITWLNTVKKHLRNGQMKVLLGRLIENYPNCEIWLEVNESNKVAIEFYTSMGFICTGKRNHYYPNGDSALLYSFNGNH